MNFRHKYVLAIDQGTTTSRAILFNRQGQVITLSQKTFQQYFPKFAGVHFLRRSELIPKESGLQIIK